MTGGKTKKENYYLQFGEKMNTILITGAFGGMGKSATKKFKNEGYTVFALDLHAGEAEEGVIQLW